VCSIYGEAKGTRGAVQHPLIFVRKLLRSRDRRLRVDPTTIKREKLLLKEKICYLI